jgi:hypothetical protein
MGRLVAMLTSGTLYNIEIKELAVMGRQEISERIFGDIRVLHGRLPTDDMRQRTSDGRFS